MFPILDDDVKKFDLFSKERLMIPILFNIKHAIEIFIKTLMKCLGVSSVPHHHDAEILFNELKKMASQNKIKGTLLRALKKNPNDSDLLLALERIDKLPLYIENVEAFIKKYQQCEIIKGKLDNDYTINDDCNSVFRYPESNVGFSLNYESILKKISNKDIEEILKDLEDDYGLWGSFKASGYIISVYGNWKLKGY
ncbi:hypothetical protein M0P48_03215 [Candidatus Gracilibacteria bacterium]|nr:hypothetical protein [Candidatus Gracilibacteria bacterium]